jgi:O-antigen/teichoic acid export membrane protein
VFAEGNRKNLSKIMYSVGTSFVPKVVPYGFLGLIAASVGPEGMGTLGYVASLVTIFSILIGLQPQNFFNTHWSVLSDSEVSIYIKSYFLISATSILFVFLLLIVYSAIGSNLKMEVMTTPIQFAIVVIAFGLSLSNLFNVVLQYTEKYFGMFLVQNGQVVIHYLTGVLLLVVFGFDWKGMLVGQITSSLIVISLMIFHLRKFMRPNAFRFSLAAKYFSFSYPLIFHGLGLAVMASIDRIMVAEILGLPQAGIYSVCYMFGILVGMFHESIARVWAPFFYTNMNSKNIESLVKVRHYTLIYILMAFGVYLLFCIVTPFVFMFMLPDEYEVGLGILFIVGLGYTFESFRKLLAGYFFLEGRVFTIAGFSVAGAIINIICNMILIPAFGLIGAAYATLIAYILTTIAMFFVARYLASFKSVFNSCK